MSSSLTRSLRLLGWAVTVALCVAFIAHRFDTADPLETDFLALLPDARIDVVEQAAQTRLSDDVGRQIIFLLGADTPEVAVAAVDQLTVALASNPLFAVMPATAGDDFKARFEQLFEFRFQLLAPQTRGQLTAAPGELIRGAKENLFGPFAGIALRQMATDPVGLFAAYVDQFMPVGVELYEGRVPLVYAEGKAWAIATRQFSHSSFALTQLRELGLQVHALREQLARGDIELLVTGMPLFAADGEARARGDISVIGLGSLLMIAIMMVVVFRSAVPLLLAVGSIVTGIVVALAISLLVFERLHVLALVFGASLVGVSIDYALHYLCDGLRDARWRGADGVRHIFAATLLGLCTTVLAYASIAVAPFPALRQIAVFSVAGLIGAWTTVICILPALAKPWLRSPRWPIALALGYAQHFPALRTQRVATLVLLSMTAVGGVMVGVTPVDDVRTLQGASRELLGETERIGAIVPLSRDSQFILVRGADPAQTLVRDAATAVALDALVTAGRLRGFSALAQVYPSVSLQQDNYARLKTAYYDSGSIDELFNAVHVRDEVRQRHLAEFAQAQEKQVELARWLKSVGTPWNALWLGCPAQCASIITLSGFARLTGDDLARLRALPGVTVADRAATITDILAQHRVAAVELLCAAFVIAAAFMWIRFGLASALRIIAVPLGAVALSLSIVGATASINLFTIFGLVLVVGLGFDYAIFHHLKGRNDGPVALGVLLSALTSLFAFGLMSASSTSAVSNFGVVLALGTAASYLLSPIAARPLQSSGGEK